MEVITIRPALPDEARSISELIMRAAHYITIHPDSEGEKRFLLSLSANVIEDYIYNQDFN